MALLAATAAAAAATAAGGTGAAGGIMETPPGLGWIRMFGETTRGLVLMVLRTEVRISRCG